MKPGETPIGIIGLGLLGSAFAERLVSAGYSVTGHDISAQRLEAVRHMGVTPAATAAAVAEQCPRLLLSLPDSTVVRDVLSEIVDSVLPGGAIIDTTTGDPDDTVAAAKRVAGRGVSWIDATVAGSSELAKQGEAVLMAGGSSEAITAHRELLHALGRRCFHVGPVGSGARMKLVLNHVLGLNRAVLAEGLALARECGMDTAVTLEVLKSGAAYSAAMDLKGQKMLARDFQPQARLDQHLKDVRLIQALAASAGARVPLVDVHADLLTAASAAGFGNADNSAVIAAYDSPDAG